MSTSLTNPESDGNSSTAGRTVTPDKELLVSDIIGGGAD